MTDTTYRVAFIGTGRPQGTEGATGFGLAYRQADGFLRTGRCTVAASAALDGSAAALFAEKYGLWKSYTDYHEMPASEQPDIVDVCV